MVVYDLDVAAVFGEISFLSRLLLPPHGQPPLKLLGVAVQLFYWRLCQAQFLFYRFTTGYCV